MERAEFLQQGRVPFALAACERFNTQPVSGYYDEASQTWQGKLDVMAATLTLTATPGDIDNDQD